MRRKPIEKWDVLNRKVNSLDFKLLVLTWDSKMLFRKLLQGEPMYTSVIELVEDLTALSSTDSSESGEDSRESSMLVESSMQSTDVKTPGSF